MTIKDKYKNRIAFSVTELAELLGISRQHIWNSIRIGDIKKAKLGRRTLIHKSEVEKLFDIDSLFHSEFNSKKRIKIKAARHTEEHLMLGK
jgi:excisionase family DNA binding protein